MQKKRKLLKLIISAAFLVLAGTGCGTLTIPQYTTGPSKQARTVESQGLTITAEPILDKERADTYFKVNPTYRGIGIIYLQAENKSADATWLLAEENMSLHVAATNCDMNAHNQKVKGDYSGAQASFAAAIVMEIVFIPLAVPGIFMTMKAASDASVIEKNFVDKEWHNQTLSPGQSAQGFIYFNLDKQPKWANSAILRIDCPNITNQQTNTFTIPLTYETK